MHKLNKRVIFAPANKKNNRRAVARHKNKKDMKASTKIAAIAAIAAVNPEGFTVYAKTLQSVTSGYAVAVKATQNSFGADGLVSVVEYAENNKDITAVGGWLDSETGAYYYDAVVIVKTEYEARAIAEREEQKAFFYLHEMKEYRL